VNLGVSVELKIIRKKVFEKGGLMWMFGVKKGGTKRSNES
jgi:hypothetical protein